MTVSAKVLNYAARGTHGFRARHMPTKLTPPVRSIYSRNDGLQGIEEVGGVGVLYKYRDNYVLDFSKLQGSGLGALNLFGITIPSITLPSPNQVIQVATSAYNTVKNTSAAVQNAVIKTASTTINTSAQLATKGIQMLQSSASAGVNIALTKLNELKTGVGSSINTFSKTVIEPALKIATNIGGSAGQAAINTLNSAFKGAVETGIKIINKGQAAVNTLASGVDVIGQTAVKIVTPVVKAVEEGITGLTNDMIYKVQKTADNLGKIESLLIKLATSKNPATQAFLKNFNSIYGATLSKAKSNLPSAKKEAGLGIAPGVILAIPIIIGLYLLIEHALNVLQTYADGDLVKANADLIAAEANKIDSETKSQVIKDGAEYARITNEEREILIAAHNILIEALNAKDIEIQKGKDEQTKLFNAINDEQAQVNSLNEQIEKMRAQGIDPNDPNFLAVVNALQAADTELNALKNQKQQTDTELNKDIAEYQALLVKEKQITADEEQARINAYNANKQYSDLVKETGLPAGGYEYPSDNGAAAAAETDIFAMFNNPIALLAAGGLLVMVLKK